MPSPAELYRDAIARLDRAADGADEDGAFAALRVYQHTRKTTVLDRFLNGFLLLSSTKKRRMGDRSRPGDMMVTLVVMVVAVVAGAVTGTGRLGSWAVLAGVVVLAVVVAGLLPARARREVRARCWSCGYDVASLGPGLEGSVDGERVHTGCARCPECGRRWPCIAPPGLSGIRRRVTPGL